MLEKDTIPPHGGELVDLLVPEHDAARLIDESANHPKLQISERELSDLEMLSVGALSPLTGFQGEDDYRSILETMHLTTGLPWTIPVTLSLDDEALKRVGRAEAVALLPPSSPSDRSPVAVVEIDEVYKRDR